MAYRAGALIADMEFFQFHPSSLYSTKNSSPAFLISEAVRGEGAILLNSRGIRFMENAHPLKELAPRDIVARAIDKELKTHGDECVYLDISAKGKEFLEKRFPNIYKKCLEEGIDISKQPIPVVPAAHYLCGGIVSDTNGRTTIQNLYVSGESACTGVHGANRLASNSLLEGLVFSHRAFIHATEFIKKISSRDIPEYPIWNKEGTFDLQEWIVVQHNMKDVKRTMWDYVGIVRNDMRLKSAAKRITMLANEIHNFYRKSTITPEIVELRNLATVSKLIIRSAIARKDSIGLHYNSDHPAASHKMKNVVLEAGKKAKLISLNELNF
jgi:L-aspartate oxidase